MKRLSLLLVIILITLSSCASAGGENMIFFEDRDKVKSDKVISSILYSVERKDKQALISMFSNRAKSEAENFEQSIEMFFETFNDNALTWENNPGPITYETTEYGIITKQIVNWYDVTGSSKKYIFFFIEWVRDDTNEDNEGLYTLRVIEEKDIDTQFIDHELMEIPGIYYHPSE